MKEQYTTSVKVEGKGDSKAKAFASALANVQGAVLKSTNNILLRIEPQDVSVVKAEEKITKEKFLFFFLPREKKALCRFSGNNRERNHYQYREGCLRHEIKTLA